MIDEKTRALQRWANELDAKVIERTRELVQSNASLKQAQEQLVKSEKLAAIGQLAAGIAHEINNPVGFVLSNLNSLQRYMNTLLDYARHLDQLIGRHAPSLDGQLLALAQAADIEFLAEDGPALVAESQEGLTRVRDIVVDLRDFSRVDSAHQWDQVDIHRCIESTLNIVHNEIKYQADLVREYSELPPVTCIPSQINQVVLNLVVNAAQSYAGKATQGGERGTIAVRTGADPTHPDSIWFEVADAGSGIAPENLKRIFDPFFTTKPVGKGTGLGLSLTYGIVRSHGGRIDVSSTVGAGTTFRVTLPRCRPDAPPVEQQLPAASALAAT